MNTRTHEVPTSSPSDPLTPPDASARSSAPAEPARRPIPIRILWLLHWLLRLWLAVMLLVYGWSKIFLLQMGTADFGDALIQFGEMSPMGLLWRFMAFSPAVQFFAGLAEVTAGALLLVRRTAWLGALIGAADMAVVFLLNLTFDVPVKQLSGLMCLAGLVLLTPNVPRLIAFVLGRRTQPARLGAVWEHPTMRAILRWVSPTLALVIVAGSGVAFGLRTDWGRTGPASEIAGVYRVDDTGSSGLGDSTITQAAFGQNTYDGRAKVAFRFADGSLRDGQYAVDGARVTIRLHAPLDGAVGLNREYTDTVTLDTARRGVGQVVLTSPSGLHLDLTPDSERRFLFDRGFSWAPEVPINR